MNYRVLDLPMIQASLNINLFYTVGQPLKFVVSLLIEYVLLESYKYLFHFRMIYIQ